MTEKIKVYTKTDCVQCNFTKKHLDSLGVDYEEVDTTDNDYAINYVKSLGYLSLPVVEKGDVHFNGFQPDKLDKLVD